MYSMIALLMEATSGGIIQFMPVRKSLPFNNILIQVIRWVVAYTVWSPNKMKWEYVHG